MAKQVRLLVSDGGEVACLWGAFRDAGTFVLAHPYPDFRPAAGAPARARGFAGTVAARDGDKLHLVREGA